MTSYNVGIDNPMYGKRRSPQTIEKIRNAHLGRKHPYQSERQKAENNPNWKGEKVGYRGIHQWVKKYLHKPELCQMCNRVPSYDLANISGKYKRDLNDWQWLCRSCHMNLDGRMNNLKHQGVTKL